MVEDYILIYKNRKINPTKTILRREVLEKRRMLEGMNLTKIYCKHFCKCHKLHITITCQ
jgi:hypothetical protein